MPHVTPLHPLVNISGDCWEWTGTSTDGGYGQAWQPDRKRMGYWHRMNYEHFVELIPDGFQVDHLCRNPPCCNPAHLEAVTPQENTLRGFGPSAMQARQTHCKNGHPFAGDNLLITKSGRRSCRTCNRVNMREYYKVNGRKYPTPTPCVIDGCQQMRYRDSRLCSSHIYERRRNAKA